MRLDRLLDDVEPLARRGDVAATDVVAVVHDSRAVTPGALFCCLPGAHADGHDFAPAAVAGGAVALLCERALPLEVTQVVVADARTAMAPIAAAFHGHPSRALSVVGITGTNGKTTTAHLLRAVLEADGRRTGLLGTLSGVRTTPEAPELQAALAGFRADGCRGVVMEVSSHALDQHRVDGTWFELAIFTNLSQDHLDYHGTTEAYFEAKARLFEPGRTAAAVVNRDDAHGRILLDSARVPTHDFGLDDATDLVLDGDGSSFRWEGQPVRLPLVGRFNVLNALAAATAARQLGVAAAVVADALSHVAPVAGRLERVDAGQRFPVFVDYAHTPDGLEQLLAAVRPLASGRVIVVFGCGGDRDRGKRPAMGAAASAGADLAVLTSDNPRNEDPAAIIDEVLTGVRAHGERVVVEPDRRAAIGLALAEAGAGDVVVIAGKGHETTQEIGDERLPFDDREVARTVLQTRGGVRS